MEADLITDMGTQLDEEIVIFFPFLGYFAVPEFDLLFLIGGVKAQDVR